MSTLDKLKAWDYIDRHKWKCDLIIEGIVYGHIGDFHSKEAAREAAAPIKQAFPKVRFKLITDSKNQDLFDLYADYYQYYTKVEC